MSYPNSSETPLELRGIEKRLQALQPTKDPELVRTMAIYTSVQNEDGPHFSDSASAKHFTRFVRRSQIRAGLFGGLVGSLFGALLGGLCVYFTMLSPEFRRCTGDIMSDLAMTSPLYVVSTIGEGEVPASVRNILHYYDSISMQLNEPRDG